MADKPTRERAPIRVLELGTGRRQGAGGDDAADQRTVPGAPRRYSREIDPITAARIVAAAAYEPHDWRDRHAPPRLVIVRHDRPADGIAASASGDREAAARDPEQVICSCGLDGCRHERDRVEQRDAAGGGDPEA
jgi:hypothetical protein